MIQAQDCGETDKLDLSSYSSVARGLRRIFYLGEGRNAWHSTWTNKYYRGHFSTSASELKNKCEFLRKQGSVFKIEALPMVVLRSKTLGYLGIFPINNWTGYPLDNVNGIKDFVRKTRMTNQKNWTLFANLGLAKSELPLFIPSSYQSQPQDAESPLNWIRKPPNSYSSFVEATKPHVPAIDNSLIVERARRARDS